MHRRASVLAALCLVAAIAPSATTAATTNAVVVWDAYTIEALTNATTAATPGGGQTPPVSAIHAAMVAGAVYDAVNMIDGGHEPFLDELPSAPGSASLEAAVATAAHDVLVDLVPSLPMAVDERLDILYDTYMAGVPSGASKEAGIAAGAAAAAAMLDDRSDDGRYGPFTLTTGMAPGDWRPTTPGVIDPFGWVARVRPFTLKSTGQFRTGGPHALTSKAYAVEYNEVKSLGSATSTTRTAAQTAMGLFWTESPVIGFHRTFRAMAEEHDLSVVESARLFGMVSVSVADAAIGCWDDKEFWSFWRPVTAIRLGDTDGNPATVGDPTWTGVVPVPPYPDHPSGFNCLAGASVHAASAFFGTDKVAFTVHNGPLNLDRSFVRFTDVLRETIPSRMYIGLHFRKPDRDGAWLGRKVAQWVDRKAFQPMD